MFTDHSSRVTHHTSHVTGRLFELLAVIAVLTLTLVSVGISTTGGTGAQAQAGYITSINIIASTQTDHWQGYYGALSGISPNATEYPVNISTSDVGGIRHIELNISSFTPDEYLLITDSNSLNVTGLQAGNTSLIDSITGTGSDSGTNTFNNISAFDNIPVRGDIQKVHTVYINGFREGLLRDGNNNVFIAPIEDEEAMPDYNETSCNFQFILPTNYSKPITYYIYYLARPPAAVTPPVVAPRGARPIPTPELEVLPPALIDTTPPIISNVSVTIERSVIITWDTNEKSDSRVKCGMKSRQYTIEEHNTSYTRSHIVQLKEIPLKNIYENTTYYFVVNSTDPSGNSAQTEEHVFVLTPPEHRRAIIPFILQLPLTLYPHMWWLLPTTILVLVIMAILMPRYKSRRNFNSLVGKPVGTEMLMYLYTAFPDALPPVDISKRTEIDMNGVLEALHTMSNKNKLESLLGIGLVDKVECDGKVCYRISKRGKSLMDGV